MDGPSSQPGAGIFGSLRPENVVGVVVRVKTSLNDEYEGEIYCFDTTTNILVLKEQTAGSTTKFNLRFVRANFIQHVECLSIPTEPSDLSIPAPSVSDAIRREEKALASTRAQSARLGVGVSAEAQQIFDAIAKTYSDIEWDGTSILILGEVRVNPPYTADSCIGENKVAVERVKKVVDGQRAKLRKASMATAQSPPTNNTPQGGPK
eukprot:GILK01002086.1.p1 GENE.GILK01002086.1~~GILK01002086.1.p1  ORF type:complete len:207 (-),score=28.51 GILK01002086.1:130-750(-)